ncbi:MAG: hypothetical protein F6K11_05685 [Leptolyngbya sp. SIO3F4]|nr:hypothetical protein [Leptolyngbya sp. SIO3F4]
MKTSLRTTAANCLGVNGKFSVRRDVFGYIWGPMQRTLSVKDHLRRIRGSAINLSVFLVGHEPGFGGWFNQDEAREIQHAIEVMRELYDQVGVGVRKIYWRYIPVDQATGYDSVDSGEATDLTEDFSGPNDGIDVFYVQLITDAGGWSNVDGPCNKDAKGRTGAVIEIKEVTDVGNLDFGGILLAHEVGHYLGLEHTDTITNVMGSDADGDGIGSINSTSVNLTNDQGNTMKRHCSIKGAC